MKTKQKEAVSLSPCLPPWLARYFCMRTLSPPPKYTGVTAWGLGSAYCGFSPQKSSFPNSMTQPKRSVSFPGFASHCPFETRPVIQPSRVWAGLLLESFTRGSLSKKNACSASASHHLLLYLHCLPDIKQQQRGFKKEIPHLQLSLSSSFPASVSVITIVWNKQKQVKPKKPTTPSHFLLFFVLQQKNRLLSMLAVVEMGNCEVTKLVFSWNRDNKTTVASSGHLRN